MHVRLWPSDLAMRRDLPRSAANAGQHVHGKSRLQLRHDAVRLPGQRLGLRRRRWRRWRWWRSRCRGEWVGGKGWRLVDLNSTQIGALHANWGPHTYAFFKFGYENYSGGARTVWYDDVAVGNQQIGCN